MCDIPTIIDEYKERHDPAKIARAMGQEYFTLMRKLNRHDKYDLRAREIIPFVEATQRDFTLLDAIEAHFGRVAFCLNGTNSPDFHRFAREAGEALAEAAKAFADDKLEKHEAGPLAKELTELIQAAGCLLMKCHSVMEGKS